jgi:hypothetical protein
MKPASLFGGDFNTYVLWLIDANGLPINAGEIVLDGDDGRLQTVTNLKTFGVLVTAEPHFAVESPSRFVVLDMAEMADRPTFNRRTKGILYNYERNTLADVKEAAGPVHTAIKQAFTAVRLAERAGAASFAPDELRSARQCLRSLIALPQDTKATETVEETARKTVELAVTAQRVAENRNPVRNK